MSKTIEFANFTCKFGEHDLIDFAEEIVIPAFQSASVREGFDNTKYFFDNVMLFLLRGASKESAPVVCIAGRYIKDMKIKRTQYFDPDTKKIVTKEGEMHTSPSSLFALVLNNHRLLYHQEMAGAPGIDSFGTTAAKFIREQHNLVTKEAYKQGKQRERDEREARGESRKPEPGDTVTSERTTWGRIYARYPRPKVDVITLASKQSLEQFISKFRTLESFSVEIKEPNGEIDNDDFFEAVRSKKKQVNASKAVLTQSNPDGLDKPEVVDQLNSATRQGINEVTLRGVSQDGLNLSGNNKDFQLKVNTKDISSDPKIAGKEMFSEYTSIVSDETLPEIEESEELEDKIRTLVRNLNITL